MNLDNKKVVVIGTGISGIAAAELLVKKNETVVLFDGNKELDCEKFYGEHPMLKDVPMILGDIEESEIQRIIEEELKK